MLSNEYLKDFFKNEVCLSSSENAKVRDAVFPKVKELLEFIHKEDPRFGSRPMPVGSSFQGLKTNSPDEFDFNVVLVELGAFYNVPLKRRYYGLSEAIDEDSLKKTPSDIDVVSTSVPLPDPSIGFVNISYSDADGGHPIWQGADDLIFDEDIIPYLVRKKLKELLLSAIRELNLQGELRLGRKVHGPALTIRIPYNNDGIEIVIDFAPTIPNMGKLDESTFWPPVNARWPCLDKICEVKDVPIHAIAKDPFDWLLSYAKCEEVLMRDIDDDGGCRKKAHRIMKRFREKFWCKTSKPFITSYHLKNILFLECERHYEEKHWEPNMLNVRIHGMIGKLLECISKQKLPQYFNRAVNLIRVQSSTERETLELETRNITAFFEDPYSFFSEE